MTADKVTEELVEWLAGITGIKVIQDRQGVRRPSLPYIVVDLVTARDLDQHSTDETFKELVSENSEGQKEIKATPEMEIEWVFIVQAYGPSCFPHLRKVSAAAQLSQKTETLMPDIVLHEVGTINSIPDFVGQHWEQRAQANIVLRSTNSDGFVVDTVDHRPNIIEIERV